ncbi:MAG: type III secretion system export apparatus subunit SctR [Gammaproteobacteria bacterium]|nr:type III secretion system export apparatus subunit SctR [Gammaproteobacteria bacterium]MDE0274087.1 type III secretion system export apparatus subunit SctR [Gammaproteobacteria bacterium]
MENLPDPSILIVVAGVLSLLPFLVVMGTSFVKMMIVFSLVRNALGIQSIPPNIALNGIALILTLYVMAPVFSETVEILQGHRISLDNPASIVSVGSSAVVPYRQFLLKHVDDGQVDFFIETAEELWGEEYEHELTRDNLFILIPAFVVGQLTSAFEIGFLIYLPFIVVDLVISNILLAMGMMMLSPVTISLPFKLLLFVFLDGWELLIQGLVLSYK